MDKSIDVYGIGNAIMDLQLQVSEEDFARLSLTKGGMSLVAVEEQEKLINEFHGLDINQASGGSAANTIIALAQLGSSVAYGCCIGKDDYGLYYQNEMKELNVTCDTEPLDGSVTGTCVVLVTPDAERTMNTSLGASANFSSSYVDEDKIRSAKWLYVEGYLFSSELGQEAVSTAIEYAKKHNTKIAVTFSDAFIVEVFRDALEKAVESADLVFANITEAKAYVGGEGAEEILAKFKKVAPSGAMTMSDEGAWVWDASGEYFQEPFKVLAKDETGAGDMFAGAFLHSLVHTDSLQESSRLACFLASKVVSQLGPRLNCDVAMLLEEKEFLPLSV